MVAGLRIAAAQEREPGKNGAAAAADISRLAWLTGHWGGGQSGRSVEEIWTDAAGGSMFAISRTIAGGKLREFEFLRIAEHDGRLAYLASPGGRCPPTAFPLVAAEGTSAVFENPQHDFPQRIEYKLEDDTLHVRISGGTGDKAKSMSWEWKRKTPG
jgi:hypothetical protein